MHLRTPLVLGLCGTQVTGPPEGHIMAFYTKTSRLLIELCGSGLSSVSNGFQLLTRFVYLFSFSR
jgi:hypothetical protein